MENSFSWFFKRLFRWRTKDLKVKKIEKDFLVFENMGKLYWIMGLEIIWNIHCKSL